MTYHSKDYDSAGAKWAEDYTSEVRGYRFRDEAPRGSFGVSTKFVYASEDRPEFGILKGDTLYVEPMYSGAKDGDLVIFEGASVTLFDSASYQQKCLFLRIEEIGRRPDHGLVDDELRARQTAELEAVGYSTGNPRGGRILDTDYPEIGLFAGDWVYLNEVTLWGHGAIVFFPQTGTYGVFDAEQHRHIDTVPVADIRRRNLKDWMALHAAPKEPIRKVS
jgi:hypothetical protein